MTIFFKIAEENSRNIPGYSVIFYLIYIKINVTINELLYKRIYIGHETETVTLSLGCHARKKKYAKHVNKLYTGMLTVGC